MVKNHRMIVRVLIAVSILLFFGVPAMAQWQVTNHAVPIGKGPGVVGFGSAASGTSGRLLIDQGSGVDPAFEVVSGSCTLAANGVISCANSGGTVTGVSVVSANGFAGSVANPTSTPAITLSTSVNGLLQGNGTAISAASTTGTGAVVQAVGPSISGLTVTGSFTATGLVGNSSLVNSSITVNGTTCTLGIACSPTAVASSVTVGTTTVSSGANTRILFDNSGVLGEYLISGTGSVAMTTSPSFTTPTLGVASATSINKMAITAPATGSTLTIADGKTLTANNSLTLSGTDSTTMTFPSTSATIARTDTGQTFTGTQTFSTAIAATSGGTAQSTYTTGDILYASAANTLSKLPIGSSGNVLSVSGGIPAWTSVSGTGTVTNSANLANLAMVIGDGGTTGVKTVAGFTTDGTSKVILGVAGTSVGSIDFKNSTSGTINLAPATGALGTSNLVLPIASDTLVGKATTDTLTNKTISGSNNTLSNIANASLSNMAANTIKANNTGSSASPSDITVSQAAALLGILPVPQGRVTLTSGTPIIVSDVTAATTIYYTPYVGQWVVIYDGTNLVPILFSEVSVALDTTNTVSGKNYDLCLALDSGTLRLVYGPAWSTDTSRGTGAGTTELERKNGILVNKVSITGRYSSSGTVSVGADQCTYVGTFRASANGQTQVKFGSVASGGGESYIGIWNNYNRSMWSAFIGDSTDSWTYSTAAWRAADGSSTIRGSFVLGAQENPVTAEYSVPTNTTAVTSAYVGVKLDATNGFDGRSGMLFDAVANSARAQATAKAALVPSIGFHFISATENTDGAASVTYYGDNGAAANIQSGLTIQGLF